MRQGRRQDLSLPTATEARLGVLRMADSVARQAVLERARPGRLSGRDQRPALPDASRASAHRPDAWTAWERSEIARFRTVLGGREAHVQRSPLEPGAEQESTPCGN
jgi:hypothetical protein